MKDLVQVCRLELRSILRHQTLLFILRNSHIDQVKHVVQQVKTRVFVVPLGLQHLHQRVPPIAHRDIKVENLILGQDKYFKICDFGSATTNSVDFKYAPPQLI